MTRIHRSPGWHRWLAGRPSVSVERTMVAMLLSSVLASAPVSAQAPGAAPTDSTLRAAPPSSDVTQANKLLGTLMSPFCPGLTLANCPSVYAETLRVSVRERLDAGQAPDSIVESLVAAFGEGIRGAPRPQGWGSSCGRSPPSWWVSAESPCCGGCEPVACLRPRSRRRDTAVPWVPRSPLATSPGCRPNSGTWNERRRHASARGGRPTVTYTRHAGAARDPSPRARRLGHPPPDHDGAQFRDHDRGDRRRPAVGQPLPRLGRPAQLLRRYRHHHHVSGDPAQAAGEITQAHVRPEAGRDPGGRDQRRRAAHDLALPVR